MRGTEQSLLPAVADIARKAYGLTKRTKETKVEIGNSPFFPLALQSQRDRERDSISDRSAHLLQVSVPHLRAHTVA